MHFLPDPMPSFVLFLRYFRRKNVEKCRITESQ
nr:MAG TPA: hypothetical protein [Caudoviricetes sp.]